MVKAHITTKDGSTILIEGSVEEVAVLMAGFNTYKAPDNPSGGSANIPTLKTKTKTRSKSASKSKKVSAATLVADMLLAGAFKKPRGLGEIQAELKQGGHYYPNSRVATALLRAVKKKELRRIKQGKNWTYVV